MERKVYHKQKKSILKLFTTAPIQQNFFRIQRYDLSFMYNFLKIITALIWHIFLAQPLKVLHFINMDQICQTLWLAFMARLYG